MPVIGRVSGQYDPSIVEEWVKEFWEKNRVYELVKEANKRIDRRFNFIDGPPYPSSDVPHIGTAWNKTLKDIILRFKRMRGYRVFDKPGYDCHGLPIEVKVEQKLGVRVKRDIEESIGVENFINECKKLVYNNIESMTRWFRELGVFMDWSDPYLTLRDDYIEAGWWLIKKVDENGLLDRENRVVYWCPRCSTTLAEYEIEYKELHDPSIYVKFPVRGVDNEYLLIWTTTPWTLAANTFIMVNPDETYVRIRVGEETYILAKARLEHVVKETGIKNYMVIEELKGRDLEGLEYDHPLEDLIPLQKILKKYHRVVSAKEFVTMYEGTGLVHGAPGHGFEDYIVAKRICIDQIASPVDDEGRFTQEAGKYSGLYVREANEAIVEDLRDRKALLYSSIVEHKYPVCWRCKTPVIMRATPQWIVRVTLLKEKLLNEVEKVNWIPSWALDRIRNMIENLQDWILSRQRYWGTPLPIWICPNGHKLVVGSRDELVKHGGEIPLELHRPWIDRLILKCPKCGLNMKRVPDVADVWFDSAISFYAAKGHPSKLSIEDIILDFIVEGHDQLRGWFFSLLRAGVLGFNRSPYKTVLVHGFVLDEKGREMHKSLGNYVGLDEAIIKVGRDPLRLWVSQATGWEDLRFSWKNLEDAKKDLGVVWNTYVFASTYMNLDKFDPKEHHLGKYMDVLRVEDRWILSRINSLGKNVSEALENYRIHEASRLLKNFLIEDVSHWYIRLIRPRVWVEENTLDKMAAYTVLHYVLYKWLVMASPFIPYTAEKIYQDMFRNAHPDQPLSIHLVKWVEVDEEYIDEELEKEMMMIREIYEASMAARMKAGIKLRQPVRAVTIYSDRMDLFKLVSKYGDLLRSVLNTKNIEALSVRELGKIVRYKVTPNYRVLGPRYRNIAKMLFEYIETNSDGIARDIAEKGFHETIIEGVNVKLGRDELTITPTYLEGYSVEDRDWGSVAIDTRISIEEMGEGLARDVIRRIQVMRKELNLELDAKIITYIYAPADHVDLLKSHVDYIMRETRSVKLEFVNMNEATNMDGYRREWEIDEDKYVIVIKSI